MNTADAEHESWAFNKHLWSIVIITGITYLIYKYMKWREFVAKVNYMPGPKALPIIGNAFEIAEERTKVLGKIKGRFETHGPIFRIWFGLMPVIAISRAEDMEPLLSSTKNIRKSLLYIFVVQWLGDGLLTTTGAKWHNHRKLITPTFHYKMLENFHHVFVAKANLLVEKLKKKCNTKEPFDVYPFITRATLDVICETAMGTNVNAQDEEQSDYVKSVYNISELIAYRGRRMWYYQDAIFRLFKKGKEYFALLDSLHKHSNNIIEERKLTRAKNATSKKYSKDDEDYGLKNKTAFLDLLLKAAEDGFDISETSIREEVDTFMFEGHDTTSSGISFCLYCLGLHPEIQERVVEEINSVMNDEDRPITINDVAEMKYFDMVLKEALRLYPPVPLVGRNLEEDVTFGDYTVPAGVSVTLFIYFLHRDERYFPNPEKFDPDRFLPENVKGRHPYSYIPFSAGPRNCIGQKFALLEEKIVIATVLRKYKIKSVDKPEDMPILFELVLKSANGIRILLEERK